MKSASKACPIASCSNMPDAPAPITTGIRPPFGRFASKAISRSLSTSAAISAAVGRPSKPLRKLRLPPPLTFLPLPSVNTADTAKLYIGLESQRSSPAELYISTSLSLAEKRMLSLLTLGSRLRMSLSVSAISGIRLLFGHSLQLSVQG